LFIAHLLSPYFSCYIYIMSITQTVEIPASHRLTIEVPREVPAGRAVLAFFPAHSPDTFQTPTEIENVRKLLQREMSEKGTSAVTAAGGDGWEAHVRERYHFM
jgi:hypothetical protein